MGWLELLALMKRVLPLLSRVAPILETYAGARGATRGDAEALDRLSGDLKAHLATAAQTGVGLQAMLEAQTDSLLHLSDELQRLRAADTEKIVRLEQMERQMAANTRLLRTLSVLTIAL